MYSSKVLRSPSPLVKHLSGNWETTQGEIFEHLPTKRLRSEEKANSQELRGTFSGGAQFFKEGLLIYIYDALQAVLRRLNTTAEASRGNAKLVR